MTSASIHSAELRIHRQASALACRVLVARGLADGILGHIRLRIDDRSLLVRCRGRPARGARRLAWATRSCVPEERGLAYTSADDIRLVDLEGVEAAPGELAGGYSTSACDSHPGPGRCGLGGQQVLVIVLRRAVLAGLQHVDQGRDCGLALG